MSKEDDSDNLESREQEAFREGASAIYDGIIHLKKSLIWRWRAASRWWEEVSTLTQIFVSGLFWLFLAPYLYDLSTRAYTVIITQSPEISTLNPNIPEYFLSVNSALWFLTITVMLNSLDTTHFEVQRLEKRIEEVEEKIES